MAKLKKGEITLNQVYAMSTALYNSGRVDNKKKRARLDILRAKMVKRRNFSFNRSSKVWEPDQRTSSKIEFLVSSDPISYPNTSGVKIHRYPVIFWFKNIEQGGDSPFRWRTGSQKGLKKGGDANIKAGIQLQFFYHLEFVSKIYGTLFGRCRAKWPPKKTNPKKYLYFDKTSLYCVQRVLYPLFAKGFGLSGSHSNEERVEA